LFVNLFVLGLLKVFNIKTKFNQNHLITMDELKSIISDSGQFLPSKNKSIFLNLIDLEKVTIEDIMMPYTHVESINLSQNLDEILNKILNFHHDRILIKYENNESIFGILETQKLFKYLLKNKKHDLNIETIKSLSDEPYFIPNGTTLYKQIQHFQDNQEKLGLIVNEHGEFLGLITLEDILEEIVGEFNIELPSKLSNVTFDEDGWIVDGTITLRELNKKLKLNLPVNGPKTLNGLIIEFFEEIPEPNTSFKIHNKTFEVLSSQDKTVKTVKIYNN